MAIPDCTANTTVITNIGTTPNERGLTTDEFKAKFDEAPTNVKDDLNNNIIPSINEHLADYVLQPANGGTTAGTSTAYTCTSTPAPLALVDKIGVVITVHADSGASPTLNWNGLGAKPIKNADGTAATIKVNGIYTLRYNATTGNFILQGKGGGASVITVYNAGVENSPLTAFLNTNLGSATPAGSVTKQASNLEFDVYGVTNQESYRGFRTDVIDVTNIKRIFININITTATSAVEFDLCVSNTGNRFTNAQVIATKVGTGSSMLAIDVSALSGSYYIMVGGFTNGATTYHIVATISEIWYETM